MSGATTGTTINNGGEQDISGTAIATAARIEFGGLQIVSAGGTAISATVDFFGGQEVFGTASGTTIESGGIENVQSSGTTTGTTINGGTLELHVGAIAVGAITFTGVGGELFVESASAPNNMISGFAPGDTIDLEQIAFDSSGSVQLLSGNVLQVTENGTTFALNFDPAQNFSGEFFHLRPFGGAGTEIFYWP